MKKIFTILALAIGLMFVSQNANAQEYKNGIGIRFGWGYGLSYKHFFTEKGAMELVGNFRSYGAAGYKYNYIRVTGLYLVHNKISAVDGLQWYFGGGAMFQTWGGDFDLFAPGAETTNIGIVGALGLDYKFANVPISITADWLPTFILSGYGDGFGGEAGGLGVRYTF